MKIKATQHIEVEIDEAQRLQICYDYLCQRFSWNRNYRIKDDNVIHEQIGHTTHSFEFETIIRSANDNDRAMDLITKQLTTQQSNAHAS